MSKLAIITGSSKGLGKVIAQHLLLEGYVVMLSGRKAEALQATKKELCSDFPEALIYTNTVDFTNKKQVRDYLSYILNIGVPEILVNNVGGYAEGDLSSDKDGLDHMISVNVSGSYLMVKGLLGKMLSKKIGHIFTICSLLSKGVRVQAPEYTMSKHALYGMHKVLVEQLKGTKLKATAILPGSINTSSWDGIHAPKNEFVQPDDVAKIIIQALKLSEFAQVDELIVSSKNKLY